MTAAELDGFCEPRFAPVRQALHDNLAGRGDVGACVAVYLHGQPVVDLWGGWLDEAETRPWQRDSFVNVWSAGKAVAAMCLLQLVDQGKVDLDAPVAHYWPEFAQAGKERLPVRMLLNHQAGLVAVEKELPPGANILNWDLMTEALAEQTPWWEPGSRFGYHTNTFGFLLGEVLRRVDGRSIGTYLQEELSKPLGIDFFFGFGAEHDHRVADWLPYLPQAGEESQRPWLDVDPAKVAGLDRARFLAYRNPPPLPNGGVNTRVWRAAEYPSTSPHGNARALATLYGGLAHGGTVHGVHILSPKLIEQAGAIESDGEDAVLGRPNRFGLGFQLTIPGVRPLGPGPKTFGHYGNGGIIAFADPDAGVGFSYVCNRSGRSWRDPRNIALIDSVYAALGG